MLRELLDAEEFFCGYYHKLPRNYCMWRIGSLQHMKEDMQLMKD